MPRGNRKETRRMKQLRADFYEEGKRQDANPDTRHLSVCWMDGHRIDYDAAPGTTEDSHSLDHYLSVEEHPELQDDPENFRHSHLRCNTSRGNRALDFDLGDQVPDWW
jgi:hypothetical protein